MLPAFNISRLLEYIPSGDREKCTAAAAEVHEQDAHTRQLIGDEQTLNAERLTLLRSLETPQEHGGYAELPAGDRDCGSGVFLQLSSALEGDTLNPLPTAQADPTNAAAAKLGAAEITRAEAVLMAPRVHRDTVIRRVTAIDQERRLVLKAIEISERIGEQKRAAASKVISPLLRPHYSKLVYDIAKTKIALSRAESAEGEYRGRMIDSGLMFLSSISPMPSGLCGELMHDHSNVRWWLRQARDSGFQVEEPTR